MASVRHLQDNLSVCMCVRWYVCMLILGCVNLLQLQSTLTAAPCKEVRGNCLSFPKQWISYFLSLTIVQFLGNVNLSEIRNSELFPTCHCSLHSGFCLYSYDISSAGFCCFDEWSPFVSAKIRSNHAKCENTLVGQRLAWTWRHDWPLIDASYLACLICTRTKVQKTQQTESG